MKNCDEIGHLWGEGNANYIHSEGEDPMRLCVECVCAKCGLKGVVVSERELEDMKWDLNHLRIQRDDLVHRLNRLVEIQDDPDSLEAFIMVTKGALYGYNKTVLHDGGRSWAQGPGIDNPPGDSKDAS